MNAPAQPPVYGPELRVAGLTDPADAPVLDPTMRDFLELEAPSDRPEDDVFGIFFDTIPARLTALSDALARAESAAGMRLAHTLKGTCLSLGVRRMGYTAQVIEWLAAHDRLAEAAAWAARLPSELEAVRRFVRAAADHPAP